MMPPAPGRTRLASAVPPSRRVLLVLLGGVLLLGGAGWWWWSQPRVRPPLPTGIEDEEVRVAVETARDEVLAEPDSPYAWGRLGMTFLANLFANEADFSFAQASRLDPDDPRWPYARALIALKKTPQQALALLHEAYAASASWPKLRPTIALTLAEASVERGELAEAEALFQQVYDDYPQDARAAFGLGLIAMAKGDHARAERLLRQAQPNPAARKRATAQLAVIARANGDIKEAERLAEESAALGADPPWPDPILDEAVTLQVGHRGRERKIAYLENQKRFGEAAELYLQELSKGPSIRACRGAGLNLARLGRYDEALPLLRKAVELDPNHAPARYSLALTLFSRAERTQAEQPKAAEPAAWFREAIVHAQKAAELRPDHGHAYLFWGLALKHLGNFEEAVAPLRKGVAIDPGDFQLQLTLGEVLLQTGDLQGAERHLNNAEQINADDPRLPAVFKRLREAKSQ